MNKYFTLIKKYYKQLLLIICVILIIVYLLLNKIYENFDSIHVQDLDFLSCKLKWGEWSECPTKCNTQVSRTRQKITEIFDRSIGTHRLECIIRDTASIN